MTEHTETILKRERAFDGRLVKVSVYEVQLADGSIAQREVVLHPGAVAIVALDSEQQVLMVKQWRTAAAKALYEIPAGTLEPGEEPETCAIRELREETGYRPLSLEHIGGLYTAPGYTDEFIHLFFTQELEHAPLAADADEFIELLRLPMTEALAMIERNDIQDGKTIAGLVRVARRLGI